MGATYQTVTAGSTITTTWGNNVREGLVTSFATSAARTSAVPTPAEGFPTYLQDSDALEWFDGTVYKTAMRGMGGNRWTGGGNLVTGLTTTELSIMTTPTLSLPANTAFTILANVRLLGSVANDTYVLRIRDTNAAGTQRGSFVWTCPSTLFGYNHQIVAHYETSSATSIVFCVTAQRVGGTGSLSMIAGGATESTFFKVIAESASGLVTVQATP